MVRLKGSIPVATMRDTGSFNSKMVRLKVKATTRAAIIAPRFQFQNGTIKRLPSFRIFSQRPMFQFQNGTIKRGLHSPFGQLFQRFNSKMVRLKVLRQREFVSVVLPFQFQNGTIKSLNCYRNCHTSTTVSIPKWYD